MLINGHSKTQKRMQESIITSHFAGHGEILATGWLEGAWVAWLGGRIPGSTDPFKNDMICWANTGSMGGIPIVLAFTFSSCSISSKFPISIFFYIS